MNNEPLKALGNLDTLLAQLSLPRDGHVQVQRDVECIRQALMPEADRD